MAVLGRQRWQPEQRLWVVQRLRVTLEDPGREKALTMLTSVVLRLPIPDHPDVRVADVAGAQDITANLTIRNGQVTAEIHGQRRADLPRLGA